MYTKPNKQLHGQGLQHPQVFDGKKFVVSISVGKRKPTADNEIRWLLERHGALLCSRLSPAVDYFVSDAAHESKQRLRTATHNHIAVVPVSWVHECIQQQRITAVNELQDAPILSKKKRNGEEKKETQPKQKKRKTHEEEEEKEKAVFSLQVKALGSDPPRELLIPKKNVKRDAQKDEQNDDKEQADKLFHELFPPIQQWAREEEEESQTYADWLTMERYSPSKRRNKIYLLPLGISDSTSHLKKSKGKSKAQTKGFDLVERACPSVESIGQFVECYFGMKVKLMDPLKFVKEKGKTHIEQLPYLYPIRTRYSRTHRTEQLYDMDILRVIKEFLPEDGFCVVAVTARDLYEHKDEDEIIMGRGTGDRVGVISFFHCNPLLHQIEDNILDEKTIESLWLLRTCKTTAHEMCHIFGIDHCVYFSCLMNAHASPDNADDQEAMNLCPIDLRKLSHSIGFSIKKRYEQLLALSSKWSWEREVTWLRSRLSLLPA